LITGVWFISQGNLTIETLFTFIMFLNLLLWPVRQVGRTLTDFGKSLVALSRKVEIFAETEEPAPEDRPVRCYQWLERSNSATSYSATAKARLP
jgi:ABC-type multidrug transport system fused ATPase/permease subunit